MCFYPFLRLRRTAFRLSHIADFCIHLFYLLFFLLHLYSNQSQVMGYRGWDEILMISLISSRKLGVYKIMRNTVCIMNESSVSFETWYLPPFEVKRMEMKYIVCYYTLLIFAVNACPSSKGNDHKDDQDHKNGTKDEHGN